MRRTVFFSVFFLAVLLALALLSATIRESPPFMMHGVMKNHARFHSGEDETFTLEVVLNDAEDAHGYETAMGDHSIVGGENEESLALELRDMTRRPLKDGAVLIAFEYAVPFRTERTHLYFNPAHLRIDYIEGMAATIPIGTFSYHFNAGADEATHLDYDSITVLSETGPSGASAVGACISFKATGDDTVVIESIDTGTPALRGNMDYLTRRERPVTPLTPIDAITGGLFNPKSPSLNPLSATLPGGDKIPLCVPFIKENTLPGEAFPFIITYAVAGEAHVRIIDDVRYIRNTADTPFHLEETARATLE